RFVVPLVFGRGLRLVFDLFPRHHGRRIMCVDSHCGASGYREVIAGEFSPTIASVICFKATWAAAERAISSSTTSNDRTVSSETYDQFFCYLRMRAALKSLVQSSFRRSQFHVQCIASTGAANLTQLAALTNK